MKVVILTEAGKTIGLGHLARCTSIYEAFKERDVSPTLVVDGDDIVRELLSDKEHQILNWTKREDIALELVVGVDVAIVDSYLAGYQLYKSISELAKIPVYLDDYKRLDYPKGVVVNGMVYAENLNYPGRDEITYLVGDKYISLRKEFCDVPERIVRDQVESVLITFGGSDPTNMTKQMLAMLCEYYPEMHKCVVLGAGFQKTEEIKCMGDTKTQFLFHLNAIDMKKVMLLSDMSISAGGQTLCELARTGVPTIAVATAENQLNSISGWVEKRSILYAGWWQNTGLLTGVHDCLEMLQSKKLRESLTFNGQRLVDGKGSMRLVGRIIDMFSGGG